MTYYSYFDTTLFLETEDSEEVIHQNKRVEGFYMESDKSEASRVKGTAPGVVPQSPVARLSQFSPTSWLIISGFSSCAEWPVLLLLQLF